MASEKRLRRVSLECCDYRRACPALLVSGFGWRPQRTGPAFEWLVSQLVPDAAIPYAGR